MAATCESLGLQYHVRSISLPSRLQNPNANAIRVESQLNKLRSFESSSVLTKTSPLTLDAIQYGLIALSELYNRTQELMMGSPSPTTQAVLIIHCQRDVVVEEALERSVEVLDSCTAIRDMFLMIKEHVQVLQSALRRPSIESDIKAYICLRKKVQKEAAKRLRILKKMESSFSFLPNKLHMDPHLNIMFGLLKDVAAITIGVLRSLLVFLANSQDSKLKHATTWSFIAKLMIKNSTASQKGIFLSNVQGVDSALYAILENLRSPDSKNYVQIARTRLDIFSSNIEGLENGLQCLFRKLISNRVTLLNILNH